MRKMTNPVVKASAWSLCLGMLVLGAAPAFAATAGKSGGLSLGAIIFLGLFALIILAQLLPGLVLFGSLIVALFTKAKARVKGEAQAGAGEAR